MAAAESTRLFPLADILSVTTGVLLTHQTPPIGAVYELLDYMTGDSLFTHQLPRAAEQCAPELIRQHPWLADITPPSDVPLTELLAWRDQMEQRYGAEHPVTAGAPDYQRKDALAELDQMMGTRPVITVRVPSTGDSS